MSRVSLRDSQQKEKDQDLHVTQDAKLQRPSSRAISLVPPDRESPIESEAAEPQAETKTDVLQHHYVRAETGDSEPDHHSIQQLAYLLWQARGGSHGSPEDDWFKARNELLARAQENR